MIITMITRIPPICNVISMRSSIVNLLFISIIIILHTNVIDCQTNVSIPTPSPSPSSSNTFTNSPISISIPTTVLIPTSSNQTRPVFVIPPSFMTIPSFFVPSSPTIISQPSSSNITTPSSSPTIPTTPSTITMPTPTTPDQPASNLFPLFLVRRPTRMPSNANNINGTNVPSSTPISINMSSSEIPTYISSDQETTLLIPSISPSTNINITTQNPTITKTSSPISSAPAINPTESSISNPPATTTTTMSPTIMTPNLPPTTTNGSSSTNRPSQPTTTKKPTIKSDTVSPTLFDKVTIPDSSSSTIRLSSIYNNNYWSFYIFIYAAVVFIII